MDLKHFLTVFTFRHWFIAVLNAGLTAFLGLGLIRGAERLGWPALSTLSGLRARRLVVLIALAKGAFYLLRGTAVRNVRGVPFALGIQFPDPYQWLGLMPMTATNIWHPTTATARVTSLLIGIAALMFFWRAWQMLSSQRRLHASTIIDTHPLEPRIPLLLAQAAIAMGMKPKARLPQVLMTGTRSPAPLLLGVYRPWLLLTPALAAALTDLEMEMLFRHELAHYLRRDHWWRWLQVWAEDISRLTGLSHVLGEHALLWEEEICDRMAVRSAEEARALGRAIDKAQCCFVAAAGTQDNSVLLDAVVPALLGRHIRLWSTRHPLRNRFEALTQYALEHNRVANIPASAPRHSFLNILSRWILQGFGVLVFSLLLFLILYVKFQAVIAHL